jgi:hypothetical protein
VLCATVFFSAALGARPIGVKALKKTVQWLRANLLKSKAEYWILERIRSKKFRCEFGRFAGAFMLDLVKAGIVELVIRHFFG